MQIADEKFKLTPDPNRVFKVIENIIAEREGIKITLVSVTRREAPHEASA